MIPNIHNKEVFDSEFDLTKSQLIFHDSSNSIKYYKVHRNSDFMEYCLALLQIKDPSKYNQILQNALVMMPLTKTNPIYLEISTIYVWDKIEKNEKFLNIAILLEKFDNMLLDQKLVSESETLDIIWKTLLLLQNLPTPSFNFHNICVKSKIVKMIELGLSKDISAKKDYLLLEPSQKTDILSNLACIIEKNVAHIQTAKLKSLLSSLRKPDSNISTILEDYYQDSQMKTQEKIEAFAYALLCKIHKKPCIFICRHEKCSQALLCNDCVEEHHVSHTKNFTEYKEFLKNELTQGKCLKILEDLIGKIPEISSLLDSKYHKTQAEIDSIFDFIESQITKVLNNKKKQFLEMMNEHKKDDNERLRIIEKQLIFHKKELQKLQEINEVVAPYLPEDLQKMLPFLGEVLFNFQPQLIEKIKCLKMMRVDLIAETLIKSLPQNEIAQIIKKFSNILDDSYALAPVLNDLEVEKLQASFLEIKPIILPKPLNNPEIFSLVPLENHNDFKFLACYQRGEIIRPWSSSSFKEKFEENSINLKKNQQNLGFLPLKTIGKKIVGFLNEINTGEKRFLAVWDYQKVISKENLQNNLIKIQQSCDILSELFEKFALPENLAVYSLEVFSEESLVCLGCESDFIQLINIEKNTRKTLKSPLSLENCGKVIVLSKAMDLPKYLLAGNSQGFISVWDISHQNILTTFSVFSQSLTTKSKLIHPTSLLNIDKNRLVIGLSNGNLQIWNYHKANLLRRLENCHQDRVNTLLLASKLQIVISCSIETGIILWDIDKFYVKKQILLMNQGVNLRANFICWCIESDLLACSTESTDNNLYLLDIGWEFKKNEELLQTRNRQKSYFSKQSSDITDFYIGNNAEEEKICMGNSSFRNRPWDIGNENREKNNKKRKASVFEAKKAGSEEVVKYIDDSVVEKKKAHIWLASEKRKTSICSLF